MTNTLMGALEMVVRTDPGLVRGQNEDSVFADAEYGLAILADGMGGYQAGEVASHMATTLLSAGLKKAFKADAAQAIELSNERLFVQQSLVEQIAAVNSAIYRAAGVQSRFGGMGTTLVAAVFVDQKMVVAHVGDSRLYRLRDDEFVVLTHDHSLLQEQIDCGEISSEEARYSANRNLVTRAVGVDSQVDAEVHLHSIHPGDVYLLCSDGLCDMVEDSAMQHVLARYGANLGLAAEQLIQLANDNGGDDNISVVLVKVLREFRFPVGRWAKLWSWFK